MNKNLYRKIIIAMMVTTLGGASAFAEDTAQASAEAAPKAPVSVAKVRPVDVTPALREELARQIAAESEKKAQKRAAKKELDPVIVIGRVAPDQAVELTLPKTVQMALDYNRDIKVAHYDLKSAEYYIDEARAGKMPQFSYTFDASRRENSGSSGMNNRDSITNSFGHGLSVNIPLYTGGRVEGQIAVAKLGKTSAQEEILRVEQATKLSAVQGYFGLLAYEELRDVYHEAVTNMQGHVDNVTAPVQCRHRRQARRPHVERLPGRRQDERRHGRQQRGRCRSEPEQHPRLAAADEAGARRPSSSLRIV